MSDSFIIQLQKNLEKLYFQEFTFDILSNDQLLSLLFLSKINSEDLSSLIKTLTNTIPTNDETINIRWSIQGITLFLNQQLENDMSIELAMKDFISINDQAINFIKKYIDYKGELKKGVAHDLSFYIQLLRDDYPGIFYSILPNLQSIIAQIQTDRVYKAIGSNFVTFYTKPPIEFISEIREFDEQEISTFFQFHTNFTHPELSQCLQEKISNTFIYPATIKGVNNSIYFTLANSTFVSKKNFFLDFVYELVDKAIGRQLDSKSVLKLIEPVYEFFPYLIVANQTILLREKNQYLQQLLKIFDSGFEHSKIIESFLNDFKFLNFISSQSGKRFGYGDLFIDSFPFLLKAVISNTDEILKFSKLNFLWTKKSQIDNDFDFVRCYGILHLFLSFQPSITSNITAVVSKITKLLQAISNEKTRSKILIDLFSCIFVTDKNDQFQCNPLLAQQVISSIISFSVPSQIYRANALFNNKKAAKFDSTITSWLNNDPAFIYGAIEKKNWLLAEKLTAFIPYYIKLYSEAMQADKFVSNNDESVAELVKANVLLSLETNKEKMVEVQKKVKSIDYINVLLNGRLSKDGEIESLCSVFDDEKKKKQVIDFADGFDGGLETSLKKIKNYPQNHSITEKSYRFDGFLSYLYKYYRCAILIDSSTFDSIEDLFKFNFLKAIEGSILHDQMKSAEELAKSVNTDLSEYVFANLIHFEVNSNFVESLSENFPLEAAALASSKHVSANLPERMKKVYEIMERKFDDDEEKVSIETVLNPEFDDFEDMIFLVDHDELYLNLMNKFDNETIATKYYKLFSFISYVSPEKDQIRIKSIEVHRQIKFATEKKNSAEIVDDLFSKGESYFSLIIDFILYLAKPEEQSSLILKLFTLSLSNDSYIDSILQAFPDHFDVILARTYYIDGVLPHLLKYAPSYKVKFLQMVSLLPSEIFHDSNIFDIDSIARSYIRYPKKILEMSKSIADWFSDENLFKILNGTKMSNLANHIFLHLHQFFEDKSAMIDFWSEMIDEKLTAMTIDSFSKEDEAIKFFHQLKDPLEMIDHLKFKQFRSLSRIVELRPFLNYKIVYSFARLRHEDFIKDIVSLCNKIDNEEAIIDLSKSFEIDVNTFFFNRAHLQLVLGDFTGAIETISKKNLRIDKLSNQRFYDTSFPFLCPLWKAPIFRYSYENEENKKSDVPEDIYTSVITFLKSIPKGVKKNVFSLMSKGAKRVMNLIISKYCSTGPALSLLISHNQFGPAYYMLKSIEKKDEEIDAFINNVFLPAAFNNIAQKFADFVAKTDKNLEETRFLWDAIIEYFTQHEMTQALIFALQVENKLEDAAIVGFESLKTSFSYVNEVSILGNIIINLKTAINYRQNVLSREENKEEEEEDEEKQDQITTENSSSSFSSSSFNVVINQAKNNDDILEYLNRAELQLSVCKFCIEKAIPFSHDYQLFSSDDDASNVCALLFLRSQYDIMDEIKNKLKLSKSEIYCKACNIICESQQQRINKFIDKLSKEEKLDMLKALAMTNNRHVFFSVIYDCFDKKEQENLFLEYNLVVDSFALAYASKDDELFPLIAHKAALLGDTRTVHECEKMLAPK